MNEFPNVTVTKKANVYFDGKVTSRTLTFADGSTGVSEINSSSRQIPYNIKALHRSNL